MIRLTTLAVIAAFGILSPLSLTTSAAQKEEPGKKEGHDHPTEGPHKGQLLELGDEEYHAEIVHDDKAGSVTVYVLDSTAKKPALTEAKEVVINLKFEGKPKQYKLKAAPQKSDKAGKTSRFAGVSKELIAALDAEDTNPLLRIIIGEKSYSAKIPHDHEHEEEAAEKPKSPKQ